MLIHDVGSIYEVRRILHDLLLTLSRMRVMRKGKVDGFYLQWRHTRYNQIHLDRQLAQIDDMVRSGNAGRAVAPRTAFT